MFSKKILSSLMIFSLCSLTFAMNNIEIVNYINHPHLPLIIKKNLVDSGDHLQWSSLNGPTISAALRIIPAKSNPSLLFAFNPYHGSEIYKSIDSAKTWTSLKIPQDTQISDLLSLDENSLLLATNQGTFVSPNNGEKWIDYTRKYQILSPKEARHLYAVNNKWILADGKNLNGKEYEDNLFASTNAGASWQLAGIGLGELFRDSQYDVSNITGQGKVLAIHTGLGVFVSTDGGFLWSSKNKNWVGLMAYVHDYSKSIAMDSHLNIYVSGGYFDTNSSNEGGMYRTDASGKTWEKLSDKIGIVVVDKKDNLYFVNYHRNNKPYYTLNKSTDKGKTWQVIKKFDESMFIRDITVLENNRIMVKTSENIILLSDESQSNFQALNLKFPLSNITAVAAIEDTVWAIDNGKTLYQSNDSGKTWKTVMGVSDMFVFNNQINIIADKRLLTSIDKGQTWQEKYKFDQPVWRVYANTDVVCVELKNNKYFLTHELQNWIAFDLDKEMKSLSVSGNRIYAANYPYPFPDPDQTDSQIKSSDDNGKTWKILLDGIYNRIRTMTSYQTNLILVAFDDVGIIKSTDGGKNWEVINNGLTTFDLEEITVINDAQYIVATKNGVFKTTDGGLHWLEESKGLANKNVISLFANTKQLLVGTKGSGVFTAVY